MKTIQRLLLISLFVSISACSVGGAIDFGDSGSSGTNGQTCVLGICF